MERPYKSPTSEWPDSCNSESPLNARRFTAIPVAAWRSKAANETAEEQQLDRDKSIIAQNAGTTAAAIYNAIVTGSEWRTVGFDAELYDSIRLHVFNGTLELAGAETVVEVFNGPNPDYSQPVQSTPPSASGSGDHGAGVTLNFGKYKGQTIQQVADSGDQGVGWLNWVARESNNDFIKKKAAEFLDANNLVEVAA